MLLRTLPTESCDPETKETYRGVPLVLNVFGEVVTTLVEMAMLVVVFDIALGDYLQGESYEIVKLSLAEYFLEYIWAIITAISVMITLLVYAGYLAD